MKSWFSVGLVIGASVLGLTMLTQAQEAAPASQPAADPPAAPAPAQPAAASANPAPVGEPRGGAPQPNPVPKSWELKFDFDDLQRIEVRVPGEAKPRVYWYMLYTVVNNTGRDVNFFPEFEIVTDKFQVIPAEMAAPPAVFEAIKKLHGEQYPHLVQPIKAIGKLLQGEDNGIDSVAIFPQIPLQVNNFTVFVGGLTGENVRMKNPAWRPDSPKDVKETFVLNKTLRIVYRLPGDPQFRDTVLPMRLVRDWVMR